MLAEEFFSSICGPPLSSNTSIAKDVGIYAHSLWPTYAAKSTFKKSSTPVNCLAVSDSHVFAAQHEKGYVHVYSRLRGNQEAFVPFPERIKCLTLAGDVLVLGTVDGRIMLWETCTGRLVSTPASHVQAVSCIVAAPYHLLTGSDDSTVHVWSLAQLLELDFTEEHKPLRSFTNHRGAITALVTTQGTNPDTSLCVSASKDKTCIIWNYQTRAVLRTLLFPTSPLCLALDPCPRALFASTEDGSIFTVEFFGPKALLGPQGEQASSVVQVTSPFAAAPSESGPASCLGLTFDGTVLLSGHPKGQIHAWNLVGEGANNSTRDLANLNAAVTNLVFVSPLAASRPTKSHTIVKPVQAQRAYTFTSQFDTDLAPEARFDSIMKNPGFAKDVLEDAILYFQQPTAGTAGDQDLQRQIDEQWEIINQQKLLQKETVDKLSAAKTSV